MRAYYRRRYSTFAGDRGTQPEVLEHGTQAGYRRHRFRGDEACAQCRAAHAALHREYRARRKAAQSA